MSIEKCGGGGVIAPSKISKKQRIACFIAGIALFTGLSLVFVTCRAEAPNYAEENKDFRIIDTIPSDYIVTFKNGWEDEFYPGGAPEMEDDPYTNYRIHLGVTTSVTSATTIKAVYDKTEKLEYDEAVKKYNKLLADMKDYSERLARGDPDAEDYLPEEDPIEPVAPTATLPYFPGSPVIDEDGVEHISVGRQPEWDYHTFIGWKIYPASPDSAGAYELTLTGAITADVTAVAQWADAPARPFKEITFQKNDGSGIFEKRLAIPTKLTYEAADPGGTDSVEWDHDNDLNTPNIYVTNNKDNAITDSVILKYEDFQIQENDVQDEPIAQNNPLVPVFTRDHYIVHQYDPWKDSKGDTIDPLGMNFANNAFIYQQWSPQQYTITFNGNGIGDETSLHNTTLTGLDAPTVARSGLVGAGQQLPIYAGTATVDNLTYYTFSHWMDAPEGGNRYYNTTPITGNTTLYAKWDVAGGAKYTFISTGAVQTFTVPTTGTYTIEAWGAQGGGVTGFTGGTSAGGGVGGLGGYSAGTITLNAGVTLYVHVGAQGAAGAGHNTNGTGGLGGYNGGGRGGNGVSGQGYLWDGGGGGGGASDVRVVGGVWDNLNSLKSRIIVAGGGGGRGVGYTPYSTVAGAGGGENGGASTGGYQQMAGATQDAGGAFGRGTDGGIGGAVVFEGKGAGGGGYYGGIGAPSGGYASGSGGSGYVKGLPETTGHSSMMSTAPEFTALTFTGGVTIAGLNTGNGKVIITFIPQQN
ncbi:hypothetical protein AGMMS50212_03810 [Spirochaetia bacterium]|nr:hypothetical protein AGMMS50212_03810 [Spirochaetia bacterium]